MSRATINPDILKWAINRAALDYSQVAQKIGVKDEYIHHLEEGLVFPTFRQAQDLAHALHIPLGYLFLSSPPQTISPIADFRTLPQAQLGHYSLELEDTLNDAMRKKDWLHDWRLQEGVEPLLFLGKFTSQNPSEVVAANIRQTLDLPQLPAKGVYDWTKQLDFLVRRAEAAGVLVLQNSVALGNNNRPLSVDEFRGFALIDSYAPVIFINTRDSVAGRIFTLAHELAHLWSGTSGISNPSIIERAGASEVERFCNRVAAEVLVPSKSFLHQWDIQGKQDLLEKAQDLAKTFRVSVFVILIRALEHDLITKDIFRKVYAEAMNQVEPIKKGPAEGGDFFNTMRVHNGRILVQDLVVALRQGDVLYREAAQLLNVQPKTLDGIMQRF
jgi:Zn-dependent peptidase ImmA (M78 family)/DNA-binding XRE family transcriptional regulator